MSYDLIIQVKQKLDELNASINRLKSTGTAFAAAERDYKIILRTEMLKLKEEKMAVGMMDKVVYGIPEVAEARFKRDIAQVVYDTNRDHINSVKLQLKILNDQISREWSNGE